MSSEAQRLALLRLTQYQLTILVDRNLAARITLHTNLTHFLVELVFDVIAHNLVAHIVDRRAAVLRSGVGITLLHAFLNLVARITTTYRTRDCSDLLAVTATDLVTQQTTGNRANNATYDLMLILDRRLTSNGYVLANFTGVLICWLIGSTANTSAYSGPPLTKL